MSAPFILKSKTTVPKLGGDILYRPVIQEKLRRLTEYPLTVVTASAGYGKTTCLLQSVYELNLPCAWYSPGPEDDNIYIFSSYLVAALDTIMPGLKDWYFKNINAGEKFNWKRAFEVLMAGMEYVEAPVSAGLLIIDDWHLLQNEKNIEAFFNRFLLCKPPCLHVVLLSREATALPAINKLRIEGKILEITNKDLTFTYEETITLLDILAPGKYSPSDLNEIHKYTEGWVMAIKLAVNAHDQTLAFTGQNISILFEYLAHDILNNQEKGIQMFLLQSAIPEYLCASMCKELFQVPVKYFDFIRTGGFFLSEVGSGQYRYHHLFREFLYHEAEKSLPDLKSLQCKTARFYWKQGQKENALTYFIKAQEWTEAGKILLEIARDLVSKGRGQAFINYLNELPAGNRAHPEFLMALGDEQCYINNYKRAIAYYRQAAEIYREKKNNYGLSQAYKGIGKVYVDIIEPGEAHLFLRKAYKILGKEHGEERANILGLLAETMINQGKPHLAERYRSLARDKNYYDDEHNLQARILLRTGKIIDAIKHLEKKSEVEKKMRKATFSYRETSLLLSMCYSMIGDVKKAREAAEEAIARGEKLKSPFVTAVGYTRLGHSMLLDQGRIKMEESWKAYDKALEQVDNLDIIRAQAEVNLGKCLLYSLEGNWAAAKRCGLDGIKISEKVKDNWFTALITHVLGMAAANCDISAEAHRHFKRAGELFYRCGDSFGQAVVNWWLSCLAWKNDDKNEFIPTFGQLLEAVNTHGYDFLLKRPTLLGDITGKISASLLEEAHKLGLLPVKKDIYPNEPALKIYTLGGIRIVTGAKNITIREWSRESALRLLSFFLTKRKTLLNKEFIMFSLWPQADNETALRNFKSALNSMLGVLEPNRRPYKPSEFVLRKGATYYFNLSANFWLDVEEFEKSFETASKIIHKNPQHAEELFSKAISLYQGDYLDGVCQDEWCIEERERLVLLYIKAAEALAGLKIEQGKFEDALAYADTILEKDICWEEAYRIKILCYGKLNNTVMRTRTFIRCWEVLETELGLKPSQKTLDIYNNI